IIWSPVRENFRINQKEVIDFPYPVTTNWVCLEFYNLQPIALGLPNYPILPEIEFKEFPQWVYDQANKKQTTSDEPYLQPEEFVKNSIINVFWSPLDTRGTRVYNDMPSTIEEQFTSFGFGSAVPSLLSEISFSQNPFASPTVRSMDMSSSLGAYVYEDYVNDPSKTYTSEAIAYSRQVNSRNVSNVNDRRPFTRSEEPSLAFERKAAHIYATKKARYNKKAYTVSVSEVVFKRKNYTSGSDDEVIHDVLVVNENQNSYLIDPDVPNTWKPEERISIPVGTGAYVTYTVGEKTYTDEFVYFDSTDSSIPSFSPVPLQGSGEIATSVIAYSEALESGRVYYRDQDFVIVYNSESKTNSIKRNNIPARLVVPSATDNADKNTVQSTAIISGKERYRASLGEAGNYVLSSGSAAVEEPQLTTFFKSESLGKSTTTAALRTDFLG
ncbi:MAG: hypothetical protein WCK43_09615, partial [bacterium]